MLTTHAVHTDAVVIQGRKMAHCGELVERRAIAAWPSCPTCQQLLGSEEQGYRSVVNDGEAEELEVPVFDDSPLLPMMADPGLPAGESIGLSPVKELVTPSTGEQLVVASLDQVQATLTLNQQTEELVPKAVALQITDTDSCTAGELVFDALRAIEQAVHAHYDPHCDRAHKLWKGLTDERSTHLKPVEDARRLLGDRIAGWKADQKRREDEAQRERERLAREEQEAAAKRQAQQALATGDVEAAAEILAEAKTMPAPIVPAAPSVVPKTGRTVTRQTWIAEIPDLAALLKAIGDRTITEFDEPIRLALQPILSRLAVTLKGELGKKYPGVEGRQKASLAGR